jgi:hypothetical protein
VAPLASWSTRSTFAPTRRRTVFVLRSASARSIGSFRTSLKLFPRIAFGISVPELSVAVRVPWPKHATLAALEKAILEALMAAGRELLEQAFRALEERLLAEGPGARQRRRRRYLLTRFGELRSSSWQTKAGGRYGYPLDRALGICPKDPCSPWVRETVARLCQAHPFRQAARLLERILGVRGGPPPGLGMGPVLRAEAPRGLGAEAGLAVPGRRAPRGGAPAPGPAPPPPTAPSSTRGTAPPR